MDPSTPAKPSDTEQQVGKQLAGQMGLPPGIGIWAVGWRRLEKIDEFRMWFLRDSSSEVLGGRWRVNTVASTRWHPKSEWEHNSKVRAMMLRDLHLVIEPVPARAWADEGLPRVYKLARPMDEGTPAETARQSLLGMLRTAVGTSVFSTAINSREPWIGPDGVWVAMDSVRNAIAQAGFSVQKARDLMDTLDHMGCKVQTGMAVDEAHRVVHDELPWVMLCDDLFTPELRAHVLLRASERDAADARGGLRMIGPS